WQAFKRPAPGAAISRANTFAALGNVNGEGRYQFWQSAAAARRAHPLAGTGAGTFEYWWARKSTIDGAFVRDAHSLYMQTLAELGIVGLALLGGFLAFALVSGGVRALRRRDDEDDAAVTAAATAAVAAFAAAAALDWVW